MKRHLTLITVHCLLITILTACGAAAPSPSQDALQSPQIPQAELATPTAAASETPAPPTVTPSPAPTSTPAPTATPIGPTPTETLLPTLELPTLAPTEPVLDVWDGLPTYPGDSTPGFYFRVKYKPSLWGLTEDSYGQPALGHREIEYCILAPSGARGMPPGVLVDHDTRKIGALFWEVNVVLLQGVRQFVTYQATDKVIFTSFQVNFVDGIDTCLADAEEVLATFTSIPDTQATPVP